MEQKNRGQGLTLVLCVILLLVNLWQGVRLSALEQRVIDAQRNIKDDIQSLEATLREQAQEEEKLVRSWTYAPSVNMEKRCVEVAVSAVLKQWQEDTAAELVWISENGGEGGGTVPLSGGGAGTFAGTLELPLDKLQLEVGLYVVLENGGARHRENLGLLGSVWELLPVQCDSRGGGTEAEFMKGVFTVYEWSAELYAKEYSLPETEGHVFRLRRNGEIAAEQAAEPGDRADSYFCGKLSSEARPGDRMALTFFCRDENGLGYEHLLRSWIAVEERDVAGDSSAWEEWPRLTWD